MERATDREVLPTLLGERVTLRRIVEGDLDALLEIFGDPRVSRFMGIRRMREPDDARALLRDIETHARRQTLLQWGLAPIDADGAPMLIGTCTLAEIDWPNRRAELGCALGSAHWGNGYMIEALPILLDHAFESLRLHRIEADVDPRNRASLRLVEKLGFRREGYLRERHFQEGEWQDSIFFGLLADDWRSRRPSPSNPHG